MKKDMYLQDIPQDVTAVGLQKVLLVRREMIHLKHVRKEIFINRTVDINSILNNLKLSLFEYIQYMSNRERQIFKIDRSYAIEDINSVVKLGETFGQLQRLYYGLEGVEYICTETIPAIYQEWFSKLIPTFTISNNISYMLSALQKQKIVIIISDNVDILTTCWCFGAKTYLNKGNKLHHFSLKTE